MTRRYDRLSASLDIALVSEHASPLAALGGVDAGGQNVHVARLAGALADRGHRVRVYTRRDAPGLPAGVPIRAGVEVRHVPAGPARPLPKDELLPYMPEFGNHLEHEWRTAPPDIVHSHFWMSGLASLHAARALGLRLAHTYHALGTVKRRHQQDADASPPDRVAWETKVGEGCDRIIATCRDEVAELAVMGLRTDGITVVPCGVDPRLFTVDGPTAPRPANRTLLVQVGRLVPRKGAAVSIAALPLLPDAVLLIVGGPPPAEVGQDPEVCRLRALARRSGVADRVVFTGGLPPEQVPALLRAADLVLCPADYEPFGIVPLEAMSCGTPVVATSVGGQRDTVVDPVTGRLVPPRNPAAMAEAVAGLLASPETAATCGRAGRRRVLTHYSWDRVAAATERVYRDVLATTGPPRTA
ncbi:glycosyl transferase [Streptomyces antimycoticus]|uniref:Glycosyl transferase n=1 Tax=Streptomyces antimycoticus TaxID=68175 RepID=A0A499VGK8_9ACTN|nr:glycosyltransferase [Streptomyces antimycoticus]BBJ45297.1 glycosyl transferase [Streptomyces antimycoticus]